MKTTALLISDQFVSANPAKCVNCWKDHLSRSSEYEVWKKKEIMKLKVTKNLTYPEPKKLYDQQPEFTFAK